MAEKEVTIKISAKNLTEAEFRKARKGLAGLGSSAKGTTAQTTGLQRAFSSFGKAAPGVLKVVTQAAAAAGAAVTGLAVAVVKLGERGAMVADVKEAFDKLSASAGETGAVMLGALQAGVKGTVTDFELMQVANTALGAGLLKTSSGAKTLAEGARLLAKRTGTDTVTAFKTLTTAMASGRTAQLKQIGLFVDNKKAVEDYAKAQGKNVSQLTDVDRAQALQIATLEALRQELENNAPPLADFGELIEQGKVGVKNLVDSLAVMISQSPPLLAGMHSIQEVIGKAFGGDQKSLILGIVNMIERAALIAIEFGLAGVRAAGIVTRGFAGIKVMVLGVQLGFATLAGSIASLIATVLEAAASVPVLGERFKAAAGLARFAADATGAFGASLKLELQDALLAAAGNDTFGTSLATLEGGINTIKTAIVNAGLSQRELNAATGEGVLATTALGGAVAVFGSQLEDWIPLAQAWEEELRIAGQKSGEWAGVTKTAIEGVKIATDSYTGSIRLQGNTMTLQTASMAYSFAQFGISTRSEMEETVKRLEKHFKKIQDSGEATAEQLGIAWAKLQEERVRLSGETAKITIGQGASMAASLAGQFASMGGKFKLFAIVEATISTYLAAAKSLAAYPWPLSMVAVAGALAAGFAQVAAIKSQGFRTGTMGLDYQDFGSSTPTVLHGREAVIPAGGGHQLAEEIAAALSRTGGPSRDTDGFAERFERIGAKLEALPRSIQRAVRDGVLLAS